MPEQQVIITIDEDGKISAQTFGFKGDTCIDAIADLLDEESNIINVKKTDEYFQKTDIQKTNAIKNKRGE